jgi:hypothetical protein
MVASLDAALAAIGPEKQFLLLADPYAADLPPGRAPARETLLGRGGSGSGGLLVLVLLRRFA